MTRLFAVLALASSSLVASAADKPLPVTVTNPVLAVEVSPSSRYQKNISSSSWQAASDGNSYFAIDGQTIDDPTGKWLVLEHVSANVLVNPGEKAGLTLHCQGADVLPGNIFVGLKSAGVFSGYERLIANEPMRC